MHSMDQDLAERLTSRVLNLIDTGTKKLADAVLEVEGAFDTDVSRWRAKCEVMERVPAVVAPSAMLQELEP